MRPRPGDAIAAAGGVALLLAMFLTWYEGPGGAERTAWEAFGAVDLVLALLGAAALGHAALQLTRRAPAAPVAAGVATAALGLLTALLVLYRIANQPGDNAAVDVRAGAWLGLLAVAVVALGAWLAVADDKPRGTPVATPVERRPAPPAA